MNSYRVKIYISKVYFSFRFLISIYSNFQLWRQTNWNIEPCRLLYWKLEPMLSGLESTNAGVVFTNVLCSSVGRDHCVTVAVWLTPALARSGAGIALNRKMLIWMLDCWVSLIGAISEKRNPWTATADWLLLAGLWSWSTHDAGLHNPHCHWHHDIMHRSASVAPQDLPRCPTRYLSTLDNVGPCMLVLLVYLWTSCLLLVLVNQKSNWPCKLI